MHRRSAVRSFRPTLESLESRDLPSTLPNIALQYLLPLSQEIATNSTNAVARLQATEGIRTVIVTNAQHPSNDFAATTYAQAASAFQEVLTDRRVLEIDFLADLHFFQGVIQTESPADQAADDSAFTNVVEPQLNIPRNQVIANENAALGTGIVNNGIDTIGPPGYVIAQDPLGNGTHLDINFPPLRPSLGFGVVTVPLYNYSIQMWPFLPPGYIPPSNNP